MRAERKSEELANEKRGREKVEGTREEEEGRCLAQQRQRGRDPEPPRGAVRPPQRNDLQAALVNVAMEGTASRLCCNTKSCSFPIRYPRNANRITR